MISIADEELYGMAVFRLQESISRMLVLSSQTTSPELRKQLVGLSARLRAEEDRLGTTTDGGLAANPLGTSATAVRPTTAALVSAGRSVEAFRRAPRRAPVAASTTRRSGRAGSRL